MAHPELALQIQEREECWEEQTASSSGESAGNGQQNMSDAGGMRNLSEKERLDRIGAYANALCKAYCEAYGPGQPVLFKMKELWGFLADSMPDGKKLR